MATPSPAARFRRRCEARERSHAPWCVHEQAGTQSRPYREKLRKARRFEEGSGKPGLGDGQQAGQGRQERRVGPVVEPQRRGEEGLGDEAPPREITRPAERSRISIARSIARSSLWASRSSLLSSAVAEEETV